MDGAVCDGVARAVQIKSELCGGSSTARVTGKLSLEISHPAEDISLFFCEEVSSLVTPLCRHNATETGECTVGFACFILKSSEMQETCPAPRLDQIKSRALKGKSITLRTKILKGELRLLQQQPGRAWGERGSAGGSAECWGAQISSRDTGKGT